MIGPRRRLIEPVGSTGMLQVEGPRRYKQQDITDAFSDLLGRPVDVPQIPRGERKQTFRLFGVSEARLYPAAMAA